MNKVVEEERQHILMLQNEISAFAENIQSNQEILDKSTKALAAGKVAGYGVMTLFLLLLLPWTCGFWLSGDTANGIFAIILMVVLYKFVVKKFLIPIARKIAEGCMGKPKEDAITASMAAISYAGEMTNEHRNEIEETHKNVTWMEGQIQSLKNNSEEVSEHLSMMKRSSMQDELDRMSF